MRGSSSSGEQRFSFYRFFLQNSATIKKSQSPPPLPTAQHLHTHTPTPSSSCQSPSCFLPSSIPADPPLNLWALPRAGCQSKQMPLQAWLSGPLFMQGMIMLRYFKRVGGESITNGIHAKQALLLPLRSLAPPHPSLPPPRRATHPGF